MENHFLLLHAVIVLIWQRCLISRGKRTKTKMASTRDRRTFLFSCASFIDTIRFFSYRDINPRSDMMEE